MIIFMITFANAFLDQVHENKAKTVSIITIGDDVESSSFKSCVT